MSEPHKNRSICVHGQINYVKIIQMMAREHFILPLSTMYETYFLNFNLPYFTEILTINNIICNWHTSGNVSTACSLLVIMTAFAKTRERQAKDQLKKSAFKLQVLCCLHPFVHSERHPSTHEFSFLSPHKGDPSPRLERSCAVGHKWLKGHVSGVYHGTKLLWVVLV